MNKKKRGLYQVGKLTFEVVILEEVSSYGRTRYRVKPVSGEGEAIIEKVVIKK